MGSLKRECLIHFIFLSEDHLHRTAVAYITYYNEGRPHQGISKAYRSTAPAHTSSVAR